MSTSTARNGASAASSASSTRPSCSAASRSTRTPAPAATASSGSPSATWRSRAVPNFPEAAIKSLAADKYQVDAEPNDQGKIVKRPAILVDHLPSPYKNEQEARATLNGALPPDLSLITKARGVESNAPFYLVPMNMLVDIVTGYQEAGADYVYAYLTGYKDPPAGHQGARRHELQSRLPIAHMTAMPNPFAGGDGLVKYDDGTPATVDNYARDVTAFLAWAADPRLEERKRLGLLVMVYLLITAVLLYFAKRRIWSKAH